MNANTTAPISVPKENPFMETESLLALHTLDHGRCRPWPFSQDVCLTCGICSGTCPVAGVDGFDPRKLVRMIALGMEDETVSARWPWICTMCGKCEALCPMDIHIPDMVRRVRSLRDRGQVPGILQKGIDAVTRVGNVLGLPKEDYLFILDDVGEELAEEPGFEGFKVPIDKVGANLFVTIHNKHINTHNHDLKHWWKIFHAAGKDWTVPSENWEGCNWGYFTGDNGTMELQVKRILDHMEKLKIANLLYPE
jgi:heterodisulfide reductase subunit C